MIDSYTINPSLVLDNHDNYDHSNKMDFLQSKHAANSLPPNCTAIFATTTTTTTSHANIDDLHRLVMNFNYSQQQYPSLPNHDHTIHPNMINAPHNLASHFPTLQPQPQPQPQPPLNLVPASFPAAFSDRLWEWNTISEANKDFTNPFK